MPQERSLCWRLNWYRQSELDGALLLGRMVRHVHDPYLVHQLTKHCADEARHAWLWQRALKTLSFRSVRIHRSYQSFYLDEMATPRGLTEVLALTHVFEHRVHRHFSDELRRPGLPDPVRRTFSILLRDEAGHLEWIARWLATQYGVQETLRRYRMVDERVARRLESYRERLWDIGGLGVELTEATDDERCSAKEEFHETQPQHSA